MLLDAGRVALCEILTHIIILQHAWPILKDTHLFFSYSSPPSSCFFQFFLPSFFKLLLLWYNFVVCFWHKQTVSVARPSWGRCKDTVVFEASSPIDRLPKVQAITGIIFSAVVNKKALPDHHSVNVKFKPFLSLAVSLSHSLISR